jgi:hypothetical protein
VIDLHEGGYLFLATPDKQHILQENHRMQQRWAQTSDIMMLMALLRNFHG